MKTKANNEVTLAFPSRSSNEGFARAAVACFAAQMDPTLNELEDIKTAVSEAVTNAIVHAYPDSIGKVVVKVRDLPGPGAGGDGAGTTAGASRTWRRPASPCSPPAGRSAAAWASPLWRALWTRLVVRSTPGTGHHRGDAQAAGAPDAERQHERHAGAAAGGPGGGPGCLRAGGAWRTTA